MKLLYFSATWCGPCKMLSPTMEKLKQEGLNIEKVDVEEQVELTAQYGIRNIPTILKVDDNGEIISRFTGAKDISWIRDFYYV